MSVLPRRAILLALPALSGCAAIGALIPDDALPTYDLAPVPGRTGARRSRVLAVPRPDAPAAIATDRILIKPDPLTVAYLPDARWSDEVPALVQSLAIRSIAATGRIGHVGAADSGPIPDVALLLRIDAFQAEPAPDAATIPVRIALAATLVRDEDQSLLASRNFTGEAMAASDSPAAIIPAFQTAIAVILPALADWTASQV
ncbi:MAG: ABC-type transport auxiliary lipoprotein family protein [Pseudomonadota bacterium]